MILIIAGTRTFNDYELLKKEVLKFIGEEKDITILDGCAEGADRLGRKLAEEMGWSIIRHPANWKRYGSSAGPIRNEEMAQAATHCIIFWDGKSPGSRSMSHFAEEYGLVTKTVLYMQKEYLRQIIELDQKLGLYGDKGTETK